MIIWVEFLDFYTASSAIFEFPEGDYELQLLNHFKELY